ncbi:apoptosis-inducing factor 3 isoform X1 [Leptinotarsa decemlineata]|uniref:apoptosis-inducing factor 3 isoform X1 n=1 Tax=Leptinotarsa decemlineata TaxID=7539 RepID=UPI003D30AB4B
MIGKSLRQGFTSLESLKKSVTRLKHFSQLLEPQKKTISGQIPNGKMGCSTSRVVEISGASGKVSSVEPSDEFVEGDVCQVDDIGENELKTFDLDEGKVLLVKQNGIINALGTKCPHYGAPLVSSALGDGRLRCQWHGACFNLATGDIEDYPAVDALPCYKVTIHDNKVRVRAKRSELESNKRTPSMVKGDPKNEKHFVVIGGGPAGAICVETLRQEGYKGRLTMVCREPYLPYDRVKVSKTMDFEIEKAQFRDSKFYKQYDIDVLKGVEATAVNTSLKTVSLSNNSQLSYDKLFIGTGCKPRKTDIPGADLRNVVVLRDYEHSKYTISQLGEDKEIVVLGSSFIALEAANYCQNKVKKVTVVLRKNLPFQPLLGPEVGAAFMDLFEKKGVHFIRESGIVRVIEDGGGNVTAVELKDGSTLKADLVIMGVGSTYYTDFLKNSGIEMQPDGSIETNNYLQTNVPDVFVGGDIAYAPVWSHGGKKSAIGHYPLAHYHGKIAALNMVGKTTELRSVPYFWTMLYGKGVRYAGHGDYDDIIYHGEVSELKFVAFYLKNDEVIAVSSCAMDPVVSQFAELLAQGKKLFRKDLEHDKLAWTKKN